MSERNRVIGDIGQWTGLLAIIIGIVIQITTRANVGDTIISVSSLIYASATKIKYYGAKRTAPKIIPLDALVKVKGRWTDGRKARFGASNCASNQNR